MMGFAGRREVDSDSGFLVLGVLDCGLRLCAKRRSGGGCI